MFFKNTFITGITLLVLLSCAGCTTMKPVDAGMSVDETIASLHPGDTIAIYTKDSEKHLVVIKTITRDYIEGDGKTFRHDDIIEIRKQQISPLKTTGAVLSGFSVVIIALIMLLVTAAGG